MIMGIYVCVTLQPRSFALGSIGSIYIELDATNCLIGSRWSAQLDYEKARNEVLYMYGVFQ